MTRTILFTALAASVFASSSAQAGPKLVIHVCKGSNVVASDDGQTTRQQNRRVQSGVIKM